MKNLIIPIFLVITFSIVIVPGITHSLIAQNQVNPPFGKEVHWITLKQGETTSVDGNLSMGFDMKVLAWAWNSAVACFPATQAHKFSGNHVLYALDLPSYTELEIDLIPADKNKDFSLYAYEVGTISDNNTVPNLSQCIRCEADHKWDYKVKGKVQDHTRHVRDILALANPYQVIIGVVGADHLTDGAFTLQVRVKGN